MLTTKENTKKTIQKGTFKTSIDKSNYNFKKCSSHSKQSKKKTKKGENKHRTTNKKQS